LSTFYRVLRQAEVSAARYLDDGGVDVDLQITQYQRRQVGLPPPWAPE
jgi:hypothetical protein